MSDSDPAEVTEADRKAFADWCAAERIKPECIGLAEKLWDASRERAARRDGAEAGLATEGSRKCWNCGETGKPCYDGGTPWCTACGVVDNPSDRLARGLADELHDAAMNTPTQDFDRRYFDGLDARSGYLLGHRDARHTIAEAILTNPKLQALARPAEPDRATESERDTLKPGSPAALALPQTVQDQLEAGWGEDTEESELDRLVRERDAARGALAPMVDNAMGYDKSLVRSAALCARGHGFSEENVQRLLKLEEDARAALAQSGGGGGNP